MPRLEILDLSWNSGVGGGALQGLLGKLYPPLRELHLVACQLTAADATVLGTNTFIMKEYIIYISISDFLHFP